MLRVWTEKSGQKHYTRNGMTETLCGVPILEDNNTDIAESQQVECEACVKVLEKDNIDEENTDIKKLKEIQSKMVELLEEAEYIIKINGSDHIYERAKAYWIAHIKTALLNETEFVGKSMVTMQDTISEIDKKLKLEEGEEEEEE